MYSTTKKRDPKEALIQELKNIETTLTKLKPTRSAEELHTLTLLFALHGVSTFHKKIKREKKKITV